MYKRPIIGGYRVSSSDISKINLKKYDISIALPLTSDYLDKSYHCITTLAEQGSFEWCIGTDDEKVIDYVRSLIGSNGIVKPVYVKKGPLGAIRQKVMDSVTGEYVLKTDADDASLPNRVKTQIAYLEKFPDIVGVSPSVQRVVGKRVNLIHYGKFLNDPVLNVVSLLLSLKRNRFNEEKLGWNVSTMLIRRDVLDKVRYDEEHSTRSDRLYAYNMWLQFPFQLLSIYEPLYIYRHFYGSVSYPKNPELDSEARRLILKRLSYIRKLVLNTPEYYNKVVTECRKYGIDYKAI